MVILKCESWVQKRILAGDKNWGLTGIMSIVMRSLNRKYRKRSLWS